MKTMFIEVQFGEANTGHVQKLVDYKFLYGDCINRQTVYSFA